MWARSPPPRAKRAPLPGLSLLTTSKPLSTGVGSSVPSLVSCKTMMSMPYLTKFAEFNNFGGQAITVPLQNSEAMFV